MDVSLIITMILVSMAIIIGTGSRLWYKSDDNPVEEVAEEVIKKQIGHDIDLTPNSPEKKDADK